MYHSINAGRLRDYIEFYTVNTESDDYGQVGGRTFVFDARAEVQTVSGDKVQQYTTTTSTIITVLMWFDNRAKNDQVIVWEGVEYTITHIKPDTMKKAMVITCEVIKK